MKSRIFLISIISLLFLSCTSSKNINKCSTNLDNELLFYKNGKEIENDYKILEKCAKLDSIDKIIFSQKIVGALMISLMSENDKLTYRTIINKINEIKYSDEYPKEKELVYLSKKMEETIISKNNWEKDKVVLIKLGMNGTYLDEFQKFITQYENTNTTYKIALNQFNKENETNKLKTNKEPFEFKKFVSYKESLNSSIQEKKYLLLYFSGYSAINCRKMEENIIIDQKVKSILNQNFTSYILYADSRKKINKKYISERNGKEIKTIGNQICDLQMIKFNSNQQPYFVILDSNGNILKEQKYTNDINEFIKFLKIE